MSVQAIVDGIDSLLLADEHEFVQYVIDVACAQKAESVEELIAIACAAGRSPKVKVVPLLEFIYGIACEQNNVTLAKWVRDAMARRSEL